MILFSCSCLSFCVWRNRIPPKSCRKKIWNSCHLCRGCYANFLCCGSYDFASRTSIERKSLLCLRNIHFVAAFASFLSTAKKKHWTDPIPRRKKRNPRPMKNSKKRRTTKIPKNTKIDRCPCIPLCRLEEDSFVNSPAASG